MISFERVREWESEGEREYEPVSSGAFGYQKKVLETELGLCAVAAHIFVLWAFSPAYKYKL